MQINLPAIYSKSVPTSDRFFLYADRCMAITISFMLAINSICVSRIMLGMRSLAAELILDPALVLNNIELSKVPWKVRGASTGQTTAEVENASFGVIDIRGRTEYELDSMGTARNYRRISDRISWKGISVSRCYMIVSEVVCWAYSCKTSLS